MSKNNRTRQILFVFILLVLVLMSCNFPYRVAPVLTPTVNLSGPVQQDPTTRQPENTAAATARPTPAVILPSPTPDAFRQLPPLRTEAVEYTVRSGDSLLGIARTYWIGLGTLIEANKVENPALIQPGDRLTIPVPAPLPVGPGNKILPDSEVIYGPSNVGFDVEGFVQQAGGHLAGYQQEIEGPAASGSQIVLRVSQDYSINPRLLLAFLEYMNGWVTQTGISGDAAEYPMGFINPGYEGLYAQLGFVANEINRGYYLWRVNSIPGFVLLDDSVVPPDAGLNAGTAGVQFALSRLLGYEAWLTALSGGGVAATYQALFGYPFAAAFDPIYNTDLAQPALILPFEPGQVWRFTGAPHGAFGGGAAWAALDFAPPGDALGCVTSNVWVTAMADGPVIRSGRGQVIQDLDGDGNEQTGWVLLYLHIETRDRIEAGTFLRAGERVGHPSCEGTVSTGTHVHIARRYNGEWIPADGPIPFNLEGWISSGTGIAYNGYLTKNGNSVQALVGTHPENQIQR